MKIHLNPAPLSPAKEAVFTSIESLSAKAKKPEVKKGKEVKVEGNTLDTLIPVQLPAEEYEEFEQTFHPKRAAKAPLAFLEEARFLVEVSAYINSLFEGLRYGLAQLEGRKAAELGDIISRDIAIAYKNSAELEKKSKDYLMGMASGKHHIIRDSLRYKGGKDILYVGLRGANVSPLLSSEHPVNSQLPLQTSSYAYEDKKASFESTYGKAIAATGLAIQTMLLGKQVGDVSSSYARSFSQHGIGLGDGTNFIAELTKIFTAGPLSKVGIPVMLPTFNGSQTDHSVKRLAKYTSILVLREPSHTIVQAKVRAKDQPNDSLGVCMEAQALQPDLRFSFAINLPKNFCEYITQTKDEQIPLVPLNTWANVWSAAMLRPPKMRTAADNRSAKGQGTYTLTPHRAPRYVLRPSVSDDLIKRRAALGLYSENGRVNEEGLMVTYNGDLAFLPTAEDSNTENAKEYEGKVEEALEISFDAGTPLAAGQRGSTGLVFDLASPKYAEKISAVKDELSKFKGSVQAVNWDLNIVLSVNVNDPDRLVATKLVGANKPDELNLANYMRSTFAKGMRDMFSRTKIVEDKGRFGVSKSSFADFPKAVTQSSIFANFALLYNHFLEIGKVPTLKDLVDSAAETLKIKNLGDEHVVDYEVLPLETTRTIYKQIIQKDLSVMDAGTKTGQIIVALLGVAATQASAKSGTNLARVCIRDNIEFAEHDRFFDGAVSTVGEFGRLYMYLGGEVFHQAIQALLKISRKDLMSIEGATTVSESDSSHPGFLNIANEVMPMCVMFAKYIAPELRDKIYEKADELKEANTESKFTEADLNLAGSKPKGANGKGGMKLFPHQGEALARLKAHPKIAVLDIAPGGGKTTIGIADIAMCYADGLIKKPFVFCPNRLVRNWVDDCHKSFNGWNVIPVTTATYAEWGDERLTDMILNAPPNTIVVVGNSFLSNCYKAQLVIGNAVDTVSNSVEFCKKFQPDYVLIDESHRIRNPKSAIHQGIKTIMQMSSAKFGRIATGTLIQNVLSDVVGQSAVFNGQIFRTLEEFEDENKGVIDIVNDKEIIDYKADTPMKARRRMAEFATVISFKRKEWAFMLPMPVETFITVDMEELKRDADGRASGKAEDIRAAEDGHKLRLFYDAVLRITLEEAKNDPKLKKKKDDDEGEDDAKDDGDRKVTTADGITIDVSDTDDDSDNTDELEAALQPYLQRLERILTDPFGDPELLPVAEEIFGKDFDKDSYVTPKVAKIIERIKLHFTEQPWVKGKEYKGSEMCDYNGKSWIFKADIAAGTGAERSDKAPDSDPDRWKPQIRGKVFITCRYTRSVDAIFKALPKDFKAKCVKFHGEISGKDGTKDGNIARFMNDDKIQLMVANEMGISEGHNFQMASRFIRCEAPWAPGELDQTASRIFRPDVGGEYTRQTIFLDWVLCDNTLEVAKMGRLISKMLKRASFDELDNTKYYQNLNPQNLPIIKMSLDNIRSLYKMDDLCAIAGEGSTSAIHGESYIGQYSYLVNQMGAEFREMRKTKRAYMIDVEPTKMPDTAKSIEFTPWVPNMPVNCIKEAANDGLVPLTEALEDEDSELALAFKTNHNALIGQFVRTEFGIGTITKVTTKRGSNTDDSDDTSQGNEISKVRVELAQGGGVEMLSASKVFLALKITERNKGKLNKTAPKITEADKKRTEKQRLKAENELKKLRARDTKAKAKLKTVKKDKPAEPEYEDYDEEDSEVNSVALYPVVYNEFLALKAAEDDVDSKKLRRFGFKKFGDYAFLHIKNYNQFTGVLDWLEAKFTLPPKTLKILDTLHDSFASGRGRKFQVELAPISELPLFYRTSHTTTVIKNKKKPEIKLYPMLSNGNLMLLVDLTTNPVFRRTGLNKTIPDASGAKFEEDYGMDICFFQSKGALIDKVKELMKVGGFTVTNLVELKEQVAGMSVKKALTNK